MRNGRHVANQRHLEAGGLERAKRTLAACARALHEHGNPVGPPQVLENATVRVCNFSLPPVALALCPVDLALCPAALAKLLVALASSPVALAMTLCKLNE